MQPRLDFIQHVYMLVVLCACMKSQNRSWWIIHLYYFLCCVIFVKYKISKCSTIQSIWIWCCTIYRYISKNVNIVKKVDIFCHSFQKMKPIYYRLITHRVKYNPNLTLTLFWSVDDEIRILHKINKNIYIYILNRNVRLLKSMFISMHSILGWTSFCMNYCINAVWHEGNQPVTLLRCNKAQVSLTVSFRSSALLGLVSLIFLLTIHRFSMRFRSGEFAGQSSTVTSWSLNQLLVPFAVWAGVNSCWKMKSASP